MKYMSLEASFYGTAPVEKKILKIFTLAFEGKYWNDKKLHYPQIIQRTICNDEVRKFIT